jgi:uncharacterized protein
MPSRALASSAPDGVFLIAAISARMLACSAARGGHRVIALDLFNDRDTRRLARASQAIPWRTDIRLGFDRMPLLAVAERLCPHERCAGLVYGTGFEDDTALLRELAEGRPLFGNSVETVGRLKDPGRFFPLLDALAIPHPAVSLTAPTSLDGWLVKRIGGSGGVHITTPGHVAGGECYYQRHSYGRSLSVLFLADGVRAFILGVSEQWTTSIGEFPYTYAGAVGPIALEPSVATRLEQDLDAFVEATGLVGCNSMDFLLERDRYAILEVNPRPSATLELYDADWPSGLFEHHLRACRGELPSKACRGDGFRAHRIVYPARPARVPETLEFPPWCSDLPDPGIHIAAHLPVCTVHAAASDLKQAQSLVLARARWIEAQLAPP